jgi:hypothetical protein
MVYEAVKIMAKMWSKKIKFAVKGECERNKDMRVIKSLHKLRNDMNVSKYRVRD